jgi:hypothetical protein
MSNKRLSMATFIAVALTAFLTAPARAEDPTPQPKAPPPVSKEDRAAGREHRKEQVAADKTAGKVTPDGTATYVVPRKTGFTHDQTKSARKERNEEMTAAAKKGETRVEDDEIGFDAKKK